MSVHNTVNIAIHPCVVKEIRIGELYVHKSTISYL